MKFPRRSAFRWQWQLWTALLLCVCTTALAAPTSKSSKKKKRSGSAKKSEVVRKAEPPAEPEILPGGIPNTRAHAVMVVDARTGEVLFEKNADEHRAAASTQKLLTA